MTLAALCCLAFAVETVRAQISPGELSSQHAGLEGVQNCTKCHTLGKKAVTNENCLACHTEIRSRMAAGTGYHANLSQKLCAECHNEHHGRAFSLVRFDTKAFDHASTGYTLEGKHGRLECAKCHTRDHIKAADVLKNRDLLTSKTYLGLPRECLGCHADTHRGQLAAQCLTCHTMDGWKPASHFSHERAKYKLIGRHIQVQCNACHKPMPDHKDVVRFVGLEFNACSSCHADPHRGKFQKPCESCHTTEGWGVGAARKFDHAVTKFPLKGLHAKVACELCHVPTRSASSGKIVQVFSVRNFQKCKDCHADVHRGEFAMRQDQGACESCHTEKGFFVSSFDHATARYRLEGKHASVDCKKCHGQSTDNSRGRKIPPDFRVKKSAHCSDCHEDAHGGQFAARNDGGACESCHTVSGYLPANFTVESHDEARFKLAGGHVATPCEACHKTKAIKARSTRQFRWKVVPACEKCHKDVHRGQFTKLMTDGCETCHSAQQWSAVRFLHDSTRFPLRGKHVGVPCNGCHKLIDVGTPGQRIQYADTPRRCVDCHSASSVTGSKAERLN